MQAYLYFTVLFSLYLSLCRAGSPCPSASNALRVCNCSRTRTVNWMEEAPVEVLAADYIFTILECEDIDYFPDLQRDLTKLRGSLIDKLIIRNVSPVSSSHKTTKFPSDLFKNIRIRNIQIFDSVLAPGFMYDGNPFVSQQVLTSLSAKHCLLQGPLTYSDCGTVVTKHLERSPTIQVLDLSYNYITCVRSTAFEKPPNQLNTINLSNNDISAVQSGAFKNSQSLRYLDLSHNILESMPRDAFAITATYLETVNFGFNLFQELPENFFSNMPALKRVNFEHNLLHSMPGKTWSGIWPQLTFLDFTGHDIECDCALKWMTESKSMFGREIRGKCVSYKHPSSIGYEYNLQNLTKEEIVC